MTVLANNEIHEGHVGLEDLQLPAGVEVQPRNITPHTGSLLHHIPYQNYEPPVSEKEEEKEEEEDEERVELASHHIAQPTLSTTL